MNTKLFIDTNVIMDFLGDRIPFYESAAKLMSLVELKPIELYTTAQSLTTTYYLISKFENPDAAKSKIRKFKPLITVCNSGNDIVERAINSDFEDLEDGVQYFSALEANCEIIITRDRNGFTPSQIPVLSPIEFLARL